MHPLVFGTKLTHLLYCVYFTVYCVYYTLKKKSSYIRKFRRDRLQSHIWLTASSHMVKYLRISSYIRKLFLIYDFATVPIWISLHMMKILLSFLSVHRVLCVLNRILCVLYRVLCVLYRVLCLLYQSTLHWPGVRQLEDGTGSWSWVLSWLGTHSCRHPHPAHFLSEKYWAVSVQLRWVCNGSLDQCPRNCTVSTWRVQQFWLLLNRRNTRPGSGCKIEI
jgi:hypothetical protein